MLPSKGILWFAMVAVLTMALAGCIGGGSNTMPDDGMPDDGMPDDGTPDDGTPDDDMTDAGLEVPTGIFASSLAPQYADDATDTVESMTGTVFAPLSVFSLRDFNENSVSIPEGDDTYIESVTQDGTGGLSVAFVINGEMTTIAFTADQLQNFDRQLVEDRYYLSGPWTFSNSNPLQRQYFRTYGWATWTDEDPDVSEGHFVYGVRTQPENLMSLGSASYQGYIAGDLWNNDGNSPRYQTHNNQIWGVLTLEADFDDSTIDGQINELWTQSSREDGRVWYELPDTNSAEISNGVIDEGRFTADWSGQDTNADSLASGQRSRVRRRHARRILWAQRRRSCRCAERTSRCHGHHSGTNH